MSGLTSQTLAAHTTLRVGGPAGDWVTVTSERELCDSVVRCDAQGTPVLILGGGSNLLVADDGFPGTVIQVAVRGMEVVSQSEDRVRLHIAAGEVWDDVVQRAVDEGWSGIEALSGIPGLTGATPVQNVGAYGQEVGQVIETVRVLDRSTGTVLDVGAGECGFGYRTSRFKAEPGRWVILAVELSLGRSGWGQPTYPELARELGVAVGDVAPITSVRSAVLLLRSRKGMVLNPDDSDTWSAGSFFTNPVVTPEVAARLPDGCPTFPAVGGVKLSAAWLIEQAGIARGFAIDDASGARISTKHTLALTNRGGARAADIVALARVVRERVIDAYGVALEPEPTLVGCSL